MNNNNNSNNNHKPNYSKSKNFVRTSPTELPGFNNNSNKNNSNNKNFKLKFNNNSHKNFKAIPNKKINPRLEPIKILAENEKSNENDITKFISLGGLQEIGKNCYLIEQGNEIILIDAGMRLVSNDTLGIDCVIPNYEYLKMNEKKLKALIITHGHEDHIGAIFYLLKTVKFPIIYAPKLAYNLIIEKLKGNNYKERFNLRNFNANSCIHTNNFKISFFEETHSIPDAFGVIIKTKNGTIVSTGDYKFDLTPLHNYPDYYKMSKLGEEGVDLMLSDSTNSLVEGITLSEKTVIQSIEEIFKNSPGRIILSTFASNVLRVQQVIKLAKKFDRKILIFGRSMEKISLISQKIGYIEKDHDLIINYSQSKELPLNKIVVLCTGSQGEPLAALSRMANSTHKEIKIVSTDTIIFSSNPIPGNTFGINQVVNKISRFGAKIILNHPSFPLHTSGHAAKEEQKIMLNLLRPKHFCPIHGEQIMLNEHARTAINCGLHPSRTFILKNGDVLALDKKHVYLLNKKVPSQNVYVDNNNFTYSNNMAINDRKIMSQNGIVSFIINADVANKKILNKPIINLNGIRFKDQIFIESICALIIDKFNKIMEKNTNIDIDQAKKELSETISSFIKDANNTEPIILPIIVIKEQKDKKTI